MQPSSQLAVALFNVRGGFQLSPAGKFLVQLLEDKIRVRATNTPRTSKSNGVPQRAGVAGRRKTGFWAGSRSLQPQ